MKNMIKLSIILLLVTISLLGCVSMETINVSPEKQIPIVNNFETINIAIKVTCSDPFSSANEDVGNALIAENVFRSVEITSSKDSLSEADIELLIVPTIIEDDHHGEEMVNAVTRGLLLGLADGAFAAKYEYTVNLEATLKQNARVFGTYEATGKYYAQKPEGNHQVQSSEVRELAWNHAIGLLLAKIKNDRKNIIESLD